MKCRCEKQFCVTCRLPELHGCNFDYKGEGRIQLEKMNPAIISKQVDPI
jgi:hypothetical protein